MKYIDDGGDIWEDVGDGMVRIIEVQGDEVTDAEACTLTDVEETFGPLTILDEDAPERPSDSLPTVSDVMSRASVFQSAHALVKGLEWDEREWASIHDVLTVAKWLEGEG